MGIYQINPPGMSEVTANLVYNIIWNLYAKKSFISGLWLRSFVGTQLFPNCFMHILPKGRYTYWKYNPANIIIAHPTFHRVCDAGSLAERKHHPTWNFEAWDSLVLEKKEEYRKFKQDNLLA